MCACCCCCCCCVSAGCGVLAMDEHARHHQARLERQDANRTSSPVAGEAGCKQDKQPGGREAGFKKTQWSSGFINESCSICES